jgi:polysaccharide deacetylase family protein (PEP-CTERM system associated)
MIANVLSVDVEEYYHAGLFRAAAQAPACAPDLPRHSRVEPCVDRLLDLLDRHAARATFFVLGEVADAHPALVRRIAAAGHEIACHGDAHDDVYRLNGREFRADVRRAKRRIEDALGSPIVGYRAPNFSIGRAQGWAYRILREEGFQYDSSSYPILHDRYGQSRAPRFPFPIAPGLLEFPIGTARVCGVNLPIGGGGYFRLLPLSFVRLGISRVNARDRRPVMFYLHPWELDAHLPRPPASWSRRLRFSVGVRRHERKIDRLLSRFRFTTARAALEAQTWLPSASAAPLSVAHAS